MTQGPQTPFIPEHEPGEINCAAQSDGREDPPLMFYLSDEEFYGDLEPEDQIMPNEIDPSERAAGGEDPPPLMFYLSDAEFYGDLEPDYQPTPDELDPAAQADDGEAPPPEFFYEGDDLDSDD